MQFLESKIQKDLNLLNNYRRISVKTMGGVLYQKSGYKEHSSVPQDGWEPFDLNTCFKEVDAHYWFKINFHTPKVDKNQKVFFKIHTSKEDEVTATNPQGIVYINGEIVQALDTNHTMVLLESDTDIEFVCYYYTGMLNERSYFVPHIIIIDKRIEELYFDVAVPLEAAKLLPTDTEDRVKIIKHLEIAMNMIHFNDVYSDGFYAEIEKARNYLKTEFYEKECGKTDLTVSCIGHTHIDIAWLWTYAQTIEKVQRSFATVLNLMKQYPEYKFMSSQAILYQHIKDYAPDMYDQIKQRIAEGRWEADGAMWLECDCNLSSGESLVRQILYGKKFMKNEFGKESKILWLPDTFGYSAAMPQILKKCGVDHFVTSKISWNDTNTIPHDTFYWEGIDGTEILTNFINAQRFSGYGDNAVRTTTYVAQLIPTYILGAYARYRDKEYNNRTMATYGFGDGGGGPTMEMLEYQRRMEKGLPGFPKTMITTAKEHLETVEKNLTENSELLGRVPKWVGELYLEYHRGTYTSIAKNKRNNRKSEFAVAKAEFLSAVNSLVLGKKYPKEEIDEIWKLILLNQFHDVLPGSSIEEVYKDSDKQYAKLLEDCAGIINGDIDIISKNISSNGGLLVFNANSTAVSSNAVLNGKTVEVKEIPAHGWKVVNPNELPKLSVTVKNNIVENRFYKIAFDSDGNIISFFDKENERDIVKPGRKFNEFIIFEDLPRDYDNWEISEYYKSKSWKFGELEGLENVYDGSRAGICIKRKYLNSTLKQNIWLYSELARVDFETEIDWHEHHQILKSFFPINVYTNKAVYDIQFGNVERNTHQNTSWDAAKFEVCAHKWADLSDGSYGVSLINDCKYGHSCIGSDLSLTLLKCGTYPNPNADQGKHIFTYSILPHKGDFRTKTIPESYSLNQPLDVKFIEKQEGILPESFSFVSIDSENAVIETIKQDEDGTGTILRLFDAHNARRNVKLTFGIPIKKAYICDMLENSIEEIAVVDNTVSLNLNNYEISTVKIITERFGLYEENEK